MIREFLNGFFGAFTGFYDHLDTFDWEIVGKSVAQTMAFFSVVGLMVGVVISLVSK